MGGPGGEAGIAGALVYLYVGSSDVGRDIDFYRRVLGAEVMWRFRAFGAEVAALRVGEGPLFLLADHRPAGSCLPIWSAPDLDAPAAALRAGGWHEKSVRVEVPDGPCLVFADPSGNQVALLRPDRPRALEHAWQDPDNERAVREQEGAWQDPDDVRAVREQ